jgi:flagellar assembly protein FliH
MMSSPVKFLFDHDFKATQEAKPSISLAAHQAELKEAEGVGYRSGFEAAKAEALVGAEHRSAAALERIAVTLEALGRGLSAVETKLETEAVEVAVAVAKKLAATLIEREPLAEIAALATGCFSQLVAAPHVVVRVNETQHEGVSEQIEKIARARGLASHLVVLAEPDIGIGDCRIEWADGGIIRDRDATAAAIDEAVARYVDARRAATGTPEIPRGADR